jgi:hyperosmotically inducible protein
MGKKSPNKMMLLVAALMATPPATTATEAAQFPAHAIQAPSEETQTRLERAVRHELLLLPYYGVFDNLVYQVNGDRVTLMGQVTRPTLKSDAERVVKHIDGVKAVDNEIEVLPVSPNDDRIRLAVYRAIYGHSGLDRYALRAIPPIHIIVKNGDVTLEGVVATEADKILAGLRADGVPGVFKVTNNLRAEEKERV